MESNPQTIKTNSSETQFYEGMTTAERSHFYQNTKINHQNYLVPDLISHSSPILVGEAVNYLNRNGISSDRIKFRIVKSHSGFGEIVAQDPPPETEINNNLEVVLSIGIWSTINDQRFSFFASNNTLRTDSSLAIDQIDTWEAHKDKVVHLFATLDQMVEINQDQLLVFFAYRVLLNRFIVDFKQYHKLSEKELLYTIPNLISETQWTAIYHALKIRSNRPFNIIDLNKLLCSFFRLQPDKIECYQTGTKIKIAFHAFGTKIDEIQMELIKYLFCPIYLTMVYNWLQPTVGDDTEHHEENKERDKHLTKPWWIKLYKITATILSTTWMILVPLLKRLSVFIWRCLAMLSMWLVRRVNLEQAIIAIIALTAMIAIGYSISRCTGPQSLLPPQQNITHQKSIEQINHLPPLEAIKKGHHNAPYVANGIGYTPLSPRQAMVVGYRQTGIASHYGNEKAGLTVSGEIFDPEKLTAAHKTLPIPSYVRVTNLLNNRHVILKINDRGPFKMGRDINVSKKAARKLGFIKEGTAKVRIELVQIPNVN